MREKRQLYVYMTTKVHTRHNIVPNSTALHHIHVQIIKKIFMFLCIWLPEMVSFSVAGFGWPRKSCRQNRFTTTIYYLPTYYLEPTNHPSSSASSITMATTRILLLV